MHRITFSVPFDQVNLQQNLPHEKAQQIWAGLEKAVMCSYSLSWLGPGQAPGAAWGTPPLQIAY